MQSDRRTAELLVARSMRVLVDRHHADLLYSLQRLFEDRLGFELYVTLGHEWWDEGYWRFGEVWGDDRLARQFLDTNDTYREVEPGLFLTFDPCHPERPLYGVTLERARGWSWDVVLATVQDNQKGFARFASESGAKYAYHIGNTRQEVDWSLDPLALNASDSPMQGQGVLIGQEFDYQTTFRYRDPRYDTPTRITSFVNLLPLIPESWGPLAELQKLLPVEYRSFGHECPDGNLTPVGAVAEEMSRATWAYHDKPTGDGFGHIIHNWAAVGRPLIGHGRYYQGQRAEVFWQDGITCIDLDKHTVLEAAQMLASVTQEQHEQMCRAIRSTLEQVYNPERDARAVAGLL